MSKESRIQRVAHSAINYPSGLRTALMELFDIGPWVAFTALAVTAALFLAAIVYFIRSAPPETISIGTGPEGGQYFKTAQKYAKVLERNGVKTKILTSKGSIENLERLNKGDFDLAFVQTGPSTTASEKLMTLGSVSYQPLLVFYRGNHLDLLSALKGKKIAIGPVGSGTHSIALAILAANGIKEGEDTTLLDQDAAEASDGLKAKTIDAAFVMSESASGDILKALMRSGDIHLFNFIQANAYSRKFEYLNVLELPQGVIDPGQDIPRKDVALIGPMVELIAVKKLHPALIDLIIEAATEVHARPGIFQKRGEFPMATEHTIPLSEDASVFYKSGKSYLYRVLPFWLASMISRALLVFLPLLLILVPSLKSIPAFFRWMAQLRIRRRYRELRMLEQKFIGETDPKKKEALRRELDRIDENVDQMKVRASFAEQFYGLRGHIDYVRKVVDRPRA